MRLSANKAFVFDCHPTLARDGDQWVCAWLQCQSGSDVVMAKALSSPDPPVALSSPPATAGPPQLCASSSGVLCAWESCLDGKWQLQIKRSADGAWSDGPVLPPSDAHRFEPALGVGPDDRVWCAWVEWDGRRRLKAADLSVPSPRVVEVRLTRHACYRPKLTRAGETLWLTWEAYTQNGYRIFSRRVGEMRQATLHWSASGCDLLHTTGAESKGRLWIAWIHSQDVENELGVVDQWQSIRALRRDGDESWQHPTVADLCHGLLPKTAVWGYCGRRRHPMLVSDGERMWVLWERKETHDGGTGQVVGALCGRCFDGRRWSTERQLHRGLVNYVVHGHSQDGVARFAARDMLAEAQWDSGVSNVLESVWGNLVVGDVALSADAPEFQTDEWTGWTPVALSTKREEKPSFDTNDLKLFWGDPHLHTAQSGDAEGEVDELLRYARDKAKLDFCAVADNDVYCFPLTDHEWARQQRFISEHSEPGRFIVIPLYEWSWADPETRKPNHRLVMYSKLHEPLWRQVDPQGTDIDALAHAVAGTSGLLIGHHLGWVFADSPVEAAIEIVSAWHPHMVEKPEFIHDTLNTGRRLAFTGGTDSHRRNPGFCGALTGIYATDLTAEALVEGVRRRRTVATTGAMIAMDFRVGDAFIGDDVSARAPIPICVRVRAPRPIESIAVVRDGEIIAESGDVGAAEGELTFEDSPPTGPHWYYAQAKLYGDVPKLPSNVVVAEGNHAWTSPIWVDVAG